MSVEPVAPATPLPADVESTPEARSLADDARALASLAARERFLQALEQAFGDGTARRLVLSKPCDRADDLERVTARPLALHGEDCVSYLYHHRTRDITRNEPVQRARETVSGLLGARFAHAHLHTAQQELQLMASRKGRYTLLVHEAAEAPARAAQEPASHDRQKHRWVPQEASFLQALGITDERHQVVPALARKWKQINKFVEIVAHAIDEAGFAEDAALRVVDFGAGKGYLTFALADWLLRRAGGRPAAIDVAGVELRPELVRQGNEVAARCGLRGLHFEAGDVASYATGPLDVMIALHACDTATDHALHAGIRGQAAIIICSPCCHKQVRPQMHAPAPLKGLLQHGIHLGQEAEMLTDALRALLLEAHGYRAQVFEFVSLEHTSKNKMILAVRRRGVADAPAERQRCEDALAQAAALKQFYGVREQCLETLLQA